ncbi:MAG: DUF1592 domain-containing protein [Pseudomonadota bacterium]
MTKAHCGRASRTEAISRVAISTGIFALLCIALLFLSACAKQGDGFPGTASFSSGDTSSYGSPLRVRLLTASQYRNSIAYVFGEDVADRVVPPLPPFQRTGGLLASGAASVGLTSDQVSQIQQAAATIAAVVVDEEHRDFLLPCDRSAQMISSACAKDFFTSAGRLLLRKPLDSSQLSRLLQITEEATAELDDFYEGLALALESLLISPEFLFIIDRAEDDPLVPGRQRLDAYSLASRWSFLLWNAPPDGVLLDAAARDDLHKPQERAATLDRMLQSPRLEAGVRAFFDDMFAFDEFDSLAKDPEVYPAVTGATLKDAREQTLRTVIDHLLTQDADYRDLFTTRRTFMSMALAAVYGVRAPDDWVPHEFSAEEPRAGLLTHMSFLAAHSHSVRSSPTLRGKAVRELFLCQHVPDPPPNVDFSGIEDAHGAATARERLAVHNKNPSCAGCHLITDPIGLALENFDGAGGFRETERGAVLDISGELDGIFFDEVAGLAQAMREHPKAPACLVNRIYAYATGGPLSLRYDRGILDELTQRFGSEGYRFKALLRDVASNEAFVSVRTEPTGNVDDEQLPEKQIPRLTAELAASVKRNPPGVDVASTPRTANTR